MAQRLPYEGNVQRGFALPGTGVPLFHLRSRLTLAKQGGIDP